MSKVSYNGINLPYPLHSEFRMESLYDESGTDRTYLKIAATVQCLISIDMRETIGISISDGINVVGMMKAMRNKLNQQRRTLAIEVGGRDLVPVPQAGAAGTVDAKNGPQVKSCIINQFTDQSFLVTFSVEAHYWENYSNDRAAELGVNRAGNVVISNRWTDSQSIDQCRFSTRTREGKVTIRSDNISGDRVDEVRNDFAVFGLTPGFVRKSANYRVHPDGLSMTYTLVDEEQYLMPTAPAYEASGTYSESTTNNGAVRWGECTVRLKGTKTTPKIDLLSTALVVMMRKLAQANSYIKTFREGVDPKFVEAGLREPPRTYRFYRPFTLLSSSMIRTALYENSVEVTARFMMSPNAKRRIFGVPTIDLNPLVMPPAGDSPEPPQFGSRGTAGLVLRAAAYYDPSLRNVKIQQDTGNMGPGLLKVGEAGVVKEGD